MRSLNVTTALIMPLLAFLGCSGTDSETPAVIRVDGSPGVRPLVQALADEFTRSTGITFVMGGGLGSSQRVAAVADSVIDIAMASHGIDTADLTRMGLTVHEIARTAVVFAVNADVGITNLTRRDVCEILAGRATNWQRWGGADAPIVALTRPAAEVDAEIAREHVQCLRSFNPSPAVRVIERPDSMAAVLARTRGAFGLTSQVLVEGSEGRIKALQLDGVSPTPDNVLSNAYALVRRSYLLTRRQPGQHVTRFLDFVAESAGGRVIMANGGVPAPR